MVGKLQITVGGRRGSVAPDADIQPVSSGYTTLPHGDLGVLGFRGTVSAERCASRDADKILLVV